MQGLLELVGQIGIGTDTPPPVVASAVDFILEGLYALKKISRTDEWQYQGAEPARRPIRAAAPDPTLDRELPLTGTSKKKYYN